MSAFGAPRSGRSRLGTNRHAFGATASQTGAPEAGIVAREGGGFIPSHEMGGGVAFLGSVGGVA